MAFTSLPRVASQAAADRLHAQGLVTGSSLAFASLPRDASHAAADTLLAQRLVAGSSLAWYCTALELVAAQSLMTGTANMMPPLQDLVLAVPRQMMSAHRRGCLLGENTVSDMSKQRLALIPASAIRLDA